MIRNWFRQIKEANFQTKFFIFNWALYIVAIVATTVYSYARIDFVRSGIPLKRIHEDARK